MRKGIDDNTIIWNSNSFIYYSYGNDVEMRYRVYFEPEDIEADNPDEAWDMISSDLMDRHPTLRKILPIDKDGFPIKME